MRKSWPVKVSRYPRYPRDDQIGVEGSVSQNPGPQRLVGALCTQATTRNPVTQTMAAIGKSG